MPNDSSPGEEFDPDGARWRKSSYSGIGECVVVAEFGDQVAVRNSNHPDAGTVVFTRAEMGAWISGIKAGEFDDLAD